MFVILIISLIILTIIIISLLNIKKDSKSKNSKDSNIQTKVIYFAEEIKDTELAKDLLESVIGIKVCEITPSYANLIIINKDSTDKILQIKESLRKGNIKLK